MEQIILAVHLLVALAIIGLIMLQQGKGADMGASFGAGASQTLFGSDGSGNVLTRATAWLVAAFFATSFGLALIASQATAPVNDLGIEIPAATMQAEQPALDEELPMVEDDIPTATATGPVDALDAGDAVEQDVPQLD
jgi:preprotein translocase subunit SecG